MELLMLALISTGVVCLSVAMWIAAHPPCPDCKSRDVMLKNKFHYVDGDDKEFWVARFVCNRCSKHFKRENGVIS
jgi:transposase-like protein